MCRGPRIVHLSFDATGITRYGGQFIFQQFCKSLGLRRFLQRKREWPSYTDRKFHPADMLLPHLFSIVAGIGRVENTKSLKLNGLFPRLLGLPDFPYRYTLRQFLWRFNIQSLRNLKTAHDLVSQELFQRLGLRWNTVVDMDATQLTAYGRQEGEGRSRWTAQWTAVTGAFQLGHRAVLFAGPAGGSEKINYSGEEKTQTK